MEGGSAAVAGGPVVTHVWRQSNTSLIVTVQHDAGNDLIVPATQAAIGAGWAVMDGGTVASPGRIVTATACVRVNATQLQLTLTQSLASVSHAVRHDHQLEAGGGDPHLGRRWSLLGVPGSEIGDDVRR